MVIVRDRDDEGRKHAAKVAESLEDEAANVRVVEPAEGKDAADHLAAGGRSRSSSRPTPRRIISTGWK